MPGQKQLRSRTPNPFPKIKVRTFGSYLKAEEFAAFKVAELNVDYNVRRAKKKKGVTVTQSNPAIVVYRERKTRRKK